MSELVVPYPRFGQHVIYLTILSKNDFRAQIDKGHNPISSQIIRVLTGKNLLELYYQSVKIIGEFEPAIPPKEVHRKAKLIKTMYPEYIS